MKIRKKRLKKNRSSDTSEDLGSTQLVNEDELVDMLEKEVGITEVQVDSSGELEAKVEMMDGKIMRLESLVESLKKESADHMNALDDIRDNLVKLMAIYEMVSRSMNPFIDLPSGHVSPVSPSSDITSSGATESLELGEDIGAISEDVELISLDELGLERPGPSDVSPLLLETAKDVAQDGTDQDTAPSPSEPPSFDLPIDSEDTPPREPTGAGRITSEDWHTPILNEIRGTPEKIVILMRWIQFLYERIPRESLEVLLEHYVSVGWIGQKAKRQVSLHARGQIRSPPLQVRENPCDFNDWRLTTEDHMVSLFFISLLADRRVDREIISSIDSRLSNFVHGGDTNGS